jgi:hypothetical protein
MISLRCSKISSKMLGAVQKSSVKAGKSTGLDLFLP